MNSKGSKDERYRDNKHRAPPGRPRHHIVIQTEFSQ